MKKVLFCAAMVAAMSMAFVACGKKDNKNAEGEENQVTNNQGSISRAEQAVRACEAATSKAELESIEQQYSDLQFEDFTSDQQARLNAVSAKFGL